MQRISYECLEGTCKILEKYLQKMNPNSSSITYDVSQLLPISSIKSATRGERGPRKGAPNGYKLTIRSGRLPRGGRVLAGTGVKAALIKTLPMYKIHNKKYFNSKKLVN